MSIQTYFQNLNTESQSIFEKSILEKDKLGTLHNLSSCIYEFSECIPDIQEQEIFKTVCTQLESATFSLSLGLYRQALSSLRLALEMGLASIYFSTNKLELQEWLNGQIDINWSKLIDTENGVLSKRFSNAFFKDLSNHIISYNSKAKSTYRKLSEYVHGNSDTWKLSESNLKYKQNLIDDYFYYYKSISEIILFAMVCRHAKSFNESTRESLQFIPEEFSSIQEIRTLFGHS